MNGFQYDSFHKFLVSLGMFFIALPIVVYIYIVGRDTLVISQEDFDKLSDFSLQSLQQKEELLYYISQSLPCVTAASLILGVGLLSYGTQRWLAVQAELDRQVELDTHIKTANYQQMTPSEITSKTIDKLEEGEKDKLPSDRGENQTADPDRVGKILNYMKIADGCFSWIKRRYSRNYIVRRDVLVGGYPYDFIAQSKSDNVDIIFEMKNMPSRPNPGMISKNVRQLVAAGGHYENSAHRNFQVIVVVVSSGSMLESIRKAVDSVLDREKPPIRLSFEYLSAEELMANN